MDLKLGTISTTVDGGVLSAAFDSPPMNLIGPQMIHDLATLFDYLEAADEVRVVVFSSANADFFLPHVDLLARVEYTAELAAALGEDDAFIASLFRRLGELPTISIAKVAGRARGGGSEFALACDMQFASVEHAVFGQFEVGIGGTPGAGAIQRLARQLGRARALEAILGADDFDARTAEAYGWINRAVPQAELDTVVDRLAHRIARWPRMAVTETKARIGRVTLPHPDELRGDGLLMRRLAATPELQQRVAALLARGLQTPGDAELSLNDAIAALPADRWPTADFGSHSDA